MVLTERAAAALRSYLDANGLAHYRVFFGVYDVYDVYEHLEALGEVAAWEPAPTLVPGGVVIDDFIPASSGEPERLNESGILRLARAEVVLARWQWVSGEHYSVVRSLWLSAAPSAAHYAKLRSNVLRLRRGRRGSVWQVVSGHAYKDGPRTPRDAAAVDDVILSPALRQRVETDVLAFFSDEVARLHRALKVPYRRGVLLHGPPGNGKTSFVRYVGAKLPNIPVMLLRAAAAFDTSDLEEVVRRWKTQAPAILVIEDLDWLLKQVNVSTLLNLLDGVDSIAGGGLLLIATTNNPHELDPAINNRPGRFDVVVEVDRPDRAMRLELFCRKLPDTPDATRQKLATITDGLSFAHLLEVLRLSGFAAIAAGRAQRTEADLLGAAEMVKSCNEDARRGYPPKLDMPFGLAHLRKKQP
jgi:hypothetical protein